MTCWHGGSGSDVLDGGRIFIPSDFFGELRPDFGNDELDGGAATTGWTSVPAKTLSWARTVTTAFSAAVTTTGSLHQMWNSLCVAAFSAAKATIFSMAVGQRHFGRRVRQR